MQEIDQLSVKIPATMRAAAQQRLPGFTNTQIIRYALAQFLGASADEAMAATKDSRTFTKYDMTNGYPVTTG